MVIDEVGSDFEQLQTDIANGPILPNVTAEEVREYLSSRYDFNRPQPLEDLIADVEKMLRTWQVQVTHPRYFGLFNPSVTFASVVADTLVAMYNPQLANWRTSPAANEMERHTLGWLAAKFGLPESAIAIFTKSAALQYAKENIRINSVHPGYADTPLTLKRFSDPAVRQALVDRTPMGRLGTAEDIANGVLFLASDESSWVTGSELVIDGGMTAQ